MLDRTLIRRSPNSVALVVSLAVALLTILAGLFLFLLMGLHSFSAVARTTAATASLQSDRALLLPALVLFGALCLLLAPLIWRYRRRATKSIPPPSG